MTPLHFEELYQAEWQELERLLDQVLGRNKTKVVKTTVHGDRIAALYRRACEHLALARARSYPTYLQDRLDRLTSDAHQVIYQTREIGFGRLANLLAREFPSAVRAHAGYVWTSAALFVIPTIIVGMLVYLRPELILSVVDAKTAAEFEQMYSPAAEAIGRARTADTDWVMFGIYISNNVRIAFQCFAGGLLAGVGSIFFLLVNGAIIGAIGGYVTERGLSSTFYSFVVTHSAFELTAIVLSGAAGLRLGHALLAPGRLSRLQSLVLAARNSIVIVYGMTIMLLIAAAIEAFWSSARWMPDTVKYTAGAVCWLAVLAYLTFQGRRAS
jgi:uncharacterized membrane protein SpoIIM required for sporulation